MAGRTDPPDLRLTVLQERCTTAKRRSLREAPAHEIHQQFWCLGLDLEVFVHFLQ